MVRFRKLNEDGDCCAQAGMGDVVLPSTTTPGSGDRWDNIIGATTQKTPVKKRKVRIHRKKK